MVMFRTTLVLLLVAGHLPAQLPPDAVDLAKVKISETEKSVDLCPVHLVKSDPQLAAWDYKGVSYRGHTADCQAAFDEDPEGFAAAAAKHRWIDNFTAQMSMIWCPVTDEIAPGGMTQWTGLGLTWESCCQFCDASFDESDLPPALERLQARAEDSYGQTGGRYVEGASSPIAGAIALFGNVDVAETPDIPAYLEGVDLQPTYSGGIGLIFEQRCVECHRSGGPAPMAFDSYGDIRRWTRTMKSQIETRNMPPWPADPEVGEFANNRRLSTAEYDVLLAWADARFPPGEGSYEPTRNWSDDWGIGEPDHVFTIPDHTVGEDLTSEFAEFEIATDFADDRWIVATEAKPGDPYLVFGIDAGPLGSYKPGPPHEILPQGTGMLLRAGATIRARVHYSEKGAGYELTDSGTRLGVVFADDPTSIEQALRIDPMAASEFSIPAGEANHQVTNRFTMPGGGKILSFMPVMMKRGKSVLYEEILPNGERRPLLSIPRWDPVQKTRYWLKEPITASAGTVIEATAVFDNSTANVNNPDASVEVNSGPEEIFEGWVGYTLDTDR